MAVRIRLKRLGRRNRPFWRICATDKRAARDGRVIEELGHYDPHKANPDKISIRRDRVVHWLKAGGSPSKTVTELLSHVGIGPKGDEIPPRPWPKQKKAPPPKAAERLAAEKAKAEAEGASAPPAKTSTDADEATPDAEASS